MTAREGCGLELEAVSLMPLPWLFFSAICRGKMTSQNPFELCGY